MTKSDREIMEILEAFDLTRCAHSAGALAGCDRKTISHYVEVRDAGGNPFVRARRPRLIDPFLEKIEELVDRSKADVRADVVHDRIVAMGFDGDPRTTRRAVAEAKEAWRAGHRRRYRPWVPEPGMWCQFDWGNGPIVAGRKTCLFCAWLAWSRYRLVIPTWDRTMGTLVACVDATLRRLGGAPTYLLADNERTVTVEHVAGIAVRHPTMVAVGRHYGCKVESCVPYDPESKGGVEATVKIAKRDLVPTSANLVDEYASFAELWRPPMPSASGSTPGRIARPGGRRRRWWPRSGHGCTSCPRLLTPPHWARPVGSTTTRPSAGARCATRPPTATRAPRCGAGWWVTSWPSGPRPAIGG
jgi:transposase